MKLDHTNIFDHVADGYLVYYATLNGVTVGTPVMDINSDTEGVSYFLIIGTSMAIPVMSTPQHNGAFTQPGYFTTQEEAVEYCRFLVMDFVKKMNTSILQNNPLPTDSLDSFVLWAVESMYPGDFEQVLKIYRAET